MFRYLVIIVSFLTFAMGYISGIETTIDQYPHTALICIAPNYTGNQAHIGTGSVLNQKIVLTAASGIFSNKDVKAKTQQLYVRVGTTNAYYLRKVSPYGTMRRVSKVIFHKCYSEKTRKHNIALLILESDIVFSTSVKRVMITKKFPTAINEGTVSGWRGFWYHDGKEIEYNEERYLFKYKQLDLLSQAECVYKLRVYERHWRPGFLCATDRQSLLPRNDNEYGAHGIPLVINGFHQIGLSSFVHKTEPDLIVFTNVSHYYNWIVKIAKKHLCDPS